MPSMVLRWWQQIHNGGTPLLVEATPPEEPTTGILLENGVDFYLMESGSFILQE